MGFRLTLFGRSLLLLCALFLANAICWIVTGVLFGRKSDTRPILSLALLAWTLGLRHALDADHISAIDNATRGLINLGQLSVTCGLFFSLGHSTIVIAVNVAIAISSAVYDRLDGVGSVGGIVGDAVSGSFLFIVGLANSIIFWRIMRQRRRAKRRDALNLPPEHLDEHHNHMLMMRLLGPIINFVNKPWKMYPVGVLFGFGFDTASSIALLAVSALAHKKSDGSSIPSGDIVILPLLFTAGMTLVDSVDSVLMMYSYSGFPDRTFAMIERTNVLAETTDKESAAPVSSTVLDTAPSQQRDQGIELPDSTAPDPTRFKDPARDQRVKLNMMSNLSLILTAMSILVAFSISLITIMGLIGDQCSQCQAAANAPDGGGLAGRWWRGWANANDNSGYIGVAIVGTFLVVVTCWYAIPRLYFVVRARRVRSSRRQRARRELVRDT